MDVLLIKMEFAHPALPDIMCLAVKIVLLVVNNAIVQIIAFLVIKIEF